MKAIQVISLTLLSVLAANAQVIVPGRCPKPAVQENFDAANVNTKPICASLYTMEKRGFIFLFIFFTFSYL